MLYKRPLLYIMFFMIFSLFLLTPLSHAQETGGLESNVYPRVYLLEEELNINAIIPLGFVVDNNANESIYNVTIALNVSQSPLFIKKSPLGEIVDNSTNITQTSEISINSSFGDPLLTEGVVSQDYFSFTFKEVKNKSKLEFQIDLTASEYGTHTLNDSQFSYYDVADIRYPDENTTIFIPSSSILLPEPPQDNRTSYLSGFNFTSVNTPNPSGLFTTELVIIYIALFIAIPSLAVGIMFLSRFIGRWL